ncbi:hypothetical protein [Actomonas aquatica]|uniref:Lipoprotein n=1 Tax=Actomonas aquatica TaxID=2866162 RepID=A0ABZ1CB94_9BACT|nr:hypothetical protein [Opitutus sp. WL0086]WRQ88726.1 hypothetical protein K1X11_004870 [Opitutus sp. WL0086]
MPHPLPSPRRWLPALAGALCLLGLTGCETTQRLALLPSPTTPVQSDASLAMTQRHRVSLALERVDFSNETAALPSLVLRVTNLGEERLSLTPGNVRVFAGDRPIPLLTRDAYIARIHEDARRDAEAYTGQQAEVILAADASRHDPSSALANLAAAKRTNRAGKQKLHEAELLSRAYRVLHQLDVAPDATAEALLVLPATELTAGESMQVRIALDEQIYPFDLSVSAN